jgi:hypothetical protein
VTALVRLRPAERRRHPFRRFVYGITPRTDATSFTGLNRAGTILFVAAPWLMLAAVLAVTP